MITNDEFTEEYKLNFYKAYNLVVQSEIPLPELTPIKAASSHLADISIRWGSVSPHGLAGGNQLGPFLWATPDSLWLQVPRIARFLVRKGQEIFVTPEPGVAEESIRVFLLGSALGSLLLQRGHLVLHGNAIRIGDQCMVCLGESGAGKSTLAAGFMQRGFSVLADDVVPVDTECRAIPGFPRIKIWQDVADKMGIPTSSLLRIRPHIEKFNLPVCGERIDVPLPIRWVYILGSNHLDDLCLEPVKGMQRFEHLHSNTYRVRFLNGMALKPEHLQLCGKLASKVRLARLTRPRLGFSVDRMVDVILGHIAENP